MSTAAHAASSVHQTEALLYGVLVQLVVIVAAARIAGELARRFHQARAVGEIIMGVLLGPSLFGLLAPELFETIFRSVSAEPLVILSQIGLVLLMFEIGMEFDFSLLASRTYRTATVWVSSLGIVCPFLLGFAFGHYSAPFLAPGVPPITTALFVGTAFSITALPVLGRILIEFDLTRAPIGVIAVSAAAVNDVVGWLMLAIVTALAVSAFTLTEFSQRFGALAIYAAVCWFLVRPMLKRTVHRHLSQGREIGGSLLAMILVVLFISALCTYKIGIFAIFGGFMLGLLLHDERRFVDSWNNRVGMLVHVLFLPVFFTFTGLRTNIGSLDTAQAWGWCALLIFLATLGKFGACYIAGRLSGQGHIASKILGLLMNTRALMELIVINIGFDLGVISQQMFTMLVLMALFSTIITTPLLKRWLPHLSEDLRGDKAQPILKTEAA